MLTSCQISLALDERYPYTLKQPLKSENEKSSIKVLGRHIHLCLLFPSNLGINDKTEYFLQGIEFCLSQLHGEKTYLKEHNIVHSE